MSNSWTPWERAKRYGLEKPAVVILFYVTVWFNDHTRVIHDRPARISTDYEPTLRQLCGDDWQPGYDDVHERLIDRGLLKSDARDEDIRIAGRRCRWTPTDDAFEIIEYLFHDEEDIHPEWVLDEHPGPPTFRDGSELMEHRKGVMAAQHLFGSLERVVTTDTYPRVNLPQRPDIRLSGHGEQLARVEVLTDHNNTDSWETKFDAWKHPNAGATIWIFENRDHMISFWNHLLTQGLVELDGGRFGGRASNWSPRRVNDRLRRSREGPIPYKSHDISWTIPGVLEGSRVDAFEMLKRNNIILQS